VPIRQHTSLRTLGLAILVALIWGCDPPPAPPPPALLSNAATAQTSSATTPAEKVAAPATGEQTAVPLPRIDQAGLERLIAESAEQDRVLVIDFWATWCVPCIEMFEPLHKGVKELGPNVRLVSVTLDALETEAAALRFLNRHNAMEDAYLLVPDVDQRLATVEAIGERWNDLVVPAILVFGPDGKLAGEFLGSADVEPILTRVRALTEPQP